MSGKPPCPTNNIVNGHSHHIRSISRRKELPKKHENTVSRSSYLWNQAASTCVVFNFVAGEKYFGSREITDAPDKAEKLVSNLDHVAPANHIDSSPTLKSTWVNTTRYHKVIWRVPYIPHFLL